MPEVVYNGYRLEDGPWVTRNHKPFLPDYSLTVYNHSPTGFEWGYLGSGPAQLALALLLDVLGPMNVQKAVNLHQQFKRDVVARFCETWQFTDYHVCSWVTLHPYNVKIRQHWQDGLRCPGCGDGFGSSQEG